MKFMQDSNIDVLTSSWGNFLNISLTGLRGYYTNVAIDGKTDGFKSTSELTATSNNSRVLLTTGSTQQVQQKNLYDIAGNLAEWTIESAFYKGITYNNSTLSTYTVRGGSYAYANSVTPACYRGAACVSGTHTDRGFRTMLYIK